GFPEIPLDPPEFRHRKQRAPEIEADIDRLLELLAAFGEMSERGQRLLEIRERLPEGGAREGLGPRLPEVGHRLRPDLAPERMVGELLDVLRQQIRIEPLNIPPHLATLAPPPIL